MNDAQVKRVEQHYLLDPHMFHEHMAKDKLYIDTFLKNLKKNNLSNYYNFLEKMKKI